MVKKTKVESHTISFQKIRSFYKKLIPTNLDAKKHNIVSCLNFGTLPGPPSRRSRRLNLF